jgi:hypothetical protein
VVGLGQGLIEGERGVGHPDRFEDALLHLSLEGVVQVAILAAGRQRRQVAASRHHLVAVLEGLAEVGEELKVGQRLHDALGGELVGVKQPLQIPPGHAAAGAHQVAHGDLVRDLGIGHPEGG